MSGQGDTTAIISQPGSGATHTFQEWPVRTECPHCGSLVLTVLQYDSGTLTWIMCCFLMFIGLFLGCCLVPFCLDNCKDVTHICPDCKREVGRYYRI